MVFRLRLLDVPQAYAAVVMVRAQYVYLSVFLINYMALCWSGEKCLAFYANCLKGHHMTSSLRRDFPAAATAAPAEQLTQLI